MNKDGNEYICIHIITLTNLFIYTCILMFTYVHSCYSNKDLFPLFKGRVFSVYAPHDAENDVLINNNVP